MELNTGASGRLVSLDVMRGGTMAAMILVNYPGSEEHIFEPLEHAAWDGLTPTDLIFPFFLFMVGISVVFSYSKLTDAGASRGAVYKKLFFRAFKIFAVGLFLSMLPDFEIGDLRITGVLQRIAIVFLACAVIFLNTTWKRQALIAAVLLVGYWLVMTLVPTPGVGRVALERGVNLAAWVDSILLPGRMWQGTWDPEGILSTFPSIATGITGMLAGHLLRSSRTAYEKVTLLTVAGFIALVAGYIWGLHFAINKNLWSSSYVLVTSGLASLVLGTTYYIVDIAGFRKGTQPAVVFGSNAIAIYFIADVISYVFYLIPFGAHPLNEQFMSATMAAGIAPKLASMLYAMLFVTINFSIAWILYKRKIFIKL